jgi:transposase
VIEVDLYNRIREMNVVEGLSQREVARRLGISRNTVRKYWDGGVIPGACKPRKRDPVVMTEDVISAIKKYLEEDREAPQKQQHTATRIYQRLVDEKGFAGGYASVASAVREIRGRVEEAFIPLTWDLGEASQVDWGEGWFYLKDTKTKCNLFCMRLCYSCKPFVAAFPTQQSEFLLEGHRLGFEFFDGVSKRVIYDNMRTAVKEGWGRYVVSKQKSIVLLEAHYAYRSEFCRPGKGNDKGLVENLVGWFRRNFLVPMPRVGSWAELNEMLLEECRNYARHHIERHPESVGEAFNREKPYLLPLPSIPLDTSKTTTAKVQRDCLIRFDNSFYSVPARYVGETVTVKGQLEHVKVIRGGEYIASHPRSFTAGGVSYQLEHYIDLIEIKPRSVRQAQPIRRTVDKQIRQFREYLPDDSAGDKEFIAVLRLLLEYGQEPVLMAIQRCLAAGVHSAEAVRFELLQILDNTPTKTSPVSYLDDYGFEVKPTDLTAYDKLMIAGGNK